MGAAHRTPGSLLPSLNPSGNNLAPFQTHTLQITNTPWATNYSYQIISGSNATLYGSGNNCNIYVSGYGIFTIKVTIGNSRCVKSWNITFSVYSGMYSVTPNPAKERLVLRQIGEHDEPVSHVRLVNLAGYVEIPTILSKGSGFIELDVTNIPNGIYVVEISGDLLHEKKKIIINR